MFKYLMSGVTGRMGKNILNLSIESQLGDCSYGFTRRPLEPFHVADLSQVVAEKVDVVIDFSLPEGFEASLKWAQNNKKAFFSGTTGLAEHHKSLLLEASSTIPVLWTANTSMGINFLNEIIKQLGSLSNFDFQIVEAHHNKKIDAPSGTALFLQQTLKESVGLTVPEPLAIRGGGIYGEHQVLAMGEREVIKIEHTALTRSVFAEGALKGAQWLVGRPAGLYTMKDVLGL